MTATPSTDAVQPLDVLEIARLQQSPRQTVYGVKYNGTLRVEDMGDVLRLAGLPDDSKWRALPTNVLLNGGWRFTFVVFA